MGSLETENVGKASRRKEKYICIEACLRSSGAGVVNEACGKIRLGKDLVNHIKNFS